ncbi:hypothetical protein [Saprospira grandis]|uniref:hypothetical protein n=1 Tax=Saprospira grandis TaxID=1008 RepID=UPI0022DD7D06|nr:hypothetical protein [Saprospira grandis]WBM75254.1 hypothetical protein OP864_03215 [Saprospira grandis]
MNQKDQKLYDKLQIIKPNIQQYKAEIEECLRLGKSAQLLSAVELKEMDSRLADIFAIEQRVLEIEQKKGWFFTQDEEVPPYPNFASFRAAIMEPLIDIIEDEGLDDSSNEIIPDRNISYKDSFLACLNINDISNWKSAFRANSTIDNYLQTVFNNFGSRITSLSLSKYAKIVARKIWVDLVVLGKSTIIPIDPEVDFEQAKPMDYNLTDDLDMLETVGPVPKRFRQRVRQFQLTMLNSQPQGFMDFAVEWKAILIHIGKDPEIYFNKNDLKNKKKTHKNMSKKQHKANYQNALSRLMILMDQNLYFTKSEYLSNEVITVLANPENGKVPSMAKRENKKGNNISSSTNFLFAPGYTTPPPSNINAGISTFNNLSLNFPTVPPAIGNTINWLTSNNFTTPANLNQVQTVLTPIASFLRNNPNTTITITGSSNYGFVNGISANPLIAIQIAQSRANSIATILTTTFRVPANQINTNTLVPSAPGVQITSP